MKIPNITELSYMQPKSRNMETKEDVEREIRKLLEAKLGEVLTPDSKERVRGAVRQILDEATSLGILPNSPDVFVYSDSDRFCKQCGRDLYLYSYKGHNNLDVDIGHPERQKICTPCQKGYNIENEHEIDYEEVENAFANGEECEQAPQACGETLTRTIS